jgi:TolA-binding protein
MTHKLVCVLAAAAVFCAATPAHAANKEHQQMMADLRMLQEQTQLLQNVLNQLTDSLKAVNTRLDQQAETQRKAFADQKLVIDNLTNDVRVIREKLDDNNVRIGSLTQEVDSLRQSLQQAPRPTQTLEPDASGAGAGAPFTAAAPPPAPTVGVSPQKLFESAQSDYYAGQYDLAVLGWTDFIKSFPKFEQAPAAQVGICNAYLNDGKYQKAVEACDVAIRTYPTAGDKVAEAYYRKGLALQGLRDLAGARDAFEQAVKADPGGENGTAGRLAKQRLDQLKRP